MEAYILLFLLLFSLSILVLSFVLPEDSSNRFCRLVSGIRRKMDILCYGFFNLIALVAILKGIYDLGQGLFKDAGTFVMKLLGFLGIAGLLYVLIYSMKRFIRER